MLAVCHPERLAAVVNFCKNSSKSPSPVKASGIEHDGRAAKTAPALAVDVPGAAGERGVRETEPRLPDPYTRAPPPPLRGDPVLDPGVNEFNLSAKRS